MASAFLLATQFLAAGTMLVLAGWLLYLKFSSPVHRAFSVFLLLVSIRTVINILRELLAAQPVSDLLYHLREYVLLASVPVLVYFVLQYTRPLRPGPWWRLAVGTTLALQLVLPLLYAWDHALATRCPDGCRTAQVAGPLSLVSFGLPLAAALSALWLARRAASVPARQRATLLLAGALLVQSLIQPTILIGVLQVQGWRNFLAGYAPSAWVEAAHVVILLGIPAAAAGLWSLHRAARGDAVATSLVHRIAWLTAVAALVGLGVGGSLRLGISPTWALFVTGLLALLAPLIVAYALVRHRLFGLDLKVRFTIKYSSVAGVFLAVFWIASTVGQEYLAESYGWALGGASAGLLLFALNPLLRLGERFSTAAMPHTRSLATMSHEERTRLFRDQAELVWTDGLMGVKERGILDQLRERLGIPAEEALRLESMAAMSHRSPSSRRNIHVQGGG